MNKKVLEGIVVGISGTLLILGALYVSQTDTFVEPVVEVKTDVPIINQEVGTSTNSTENVVTYGDGVYTDRGLGFTLNYPTDWEIQSYAPSSQPRGQQERQEKVELHKNGVRILIDPLGRLGAPSTGNIPNEKETLTINSTTWRHTWIPGYHRFTAEENAITLQEDPTTNYTFQAGTVGQMETISRHDSFRIHVNFETGSEEYQDETIEVVKKILESLSTIKI